LEDVVKMVDKDDIIVDVWDYTPYHEEYEKDIVPTLIKKIEKLKDVPKDEEPDFNKITEIQEAIAEKLGMVTQGMLQKWQEDVMEKIADEIDDVFAKFRNHRHDYSKTFTGKAEY